MPNHKAWNIDLINIIFTPDTANAIIQTPIISIDGQDTLVWKLTPAGNHSPKSAYKHCFNNLKLPSRQRPKDVPQQIIQLLNQVWQDKLMAPRVQTFAWRLLRKALPTGKRASKFSKHIQEKCSRCGAAEDEMHLFFLCPFSKAAWFSHPWYIKTEPLVADCMSIPDIIQKMLTSGHPHINLSNLYTYLWCLWKARNNMLFDRKLSRPTQVYLAANAIIQGTNLEKTTSKGDHQLAQPDKHLQTPSPYPLEKDSDLFAGNAIFCDASWSSATEKAGIGVVIYMQANQHCQQVQVSALAPQAFSPLQAEAHAMHLAAKLAGLPHIQDTHFYTDSSVLASAVASTDIFAAPSHWEVRPLMAQIQLYPAFQRNRVAHIHRSRNVKAHHQARLAMKIQSTSLAIRCLSSGAGQCPGKTILSDVSCVLPYTLLSVKCS
jgi:ribonuclease HI